MNGTITRLCIALSRHASRVGDFFSQYDEYILKGMITLAATLAISMISLMAYVLAGGLGLFFVGIFLLLAYAVWWGSKQGKSPLNQPSSGYSAISTLTASNPKLRDGWYEVVFKGNGNYFPGTGLINAFEEDIVRWLADNASSRYLVLNAGVVASKVLFKSEEDAVLFRLKFSTYSLA